MTPILNWLVLILFSGGGIVMAHWVTTKSHKGWTGPKTLVSRAFLYALILASVTGIIFVAVTVLYNSILDQGAFLKLAGVAGAVKFLLIFSGLWYAAVYALRKSDGGEG